MPLAVTLASQACSWLGVLLTLVVIYLWLSDNGGYRR